MEDKISVIVPIYKVEKYLRKCVDSIINQTYKNLEIILVDDGSPDNCPAMCDEYAKSDDRIKVIHKKNGGLSDARNVGIENSTGNYLMFVDSDDYVDTTICEVLLNLIKNNNAEVAISHYEPFIENETIKLQTQNEIIKLYDNDNKFSLLEKHNRNTIVAWGKLYKKEIFKDIRYPVGRIYEDCYVVYKYIYNAKTIVETNQRLYFYLQRKDGIMSINRNKFSFDNLQFFIDQINFYIEKNINPKYIYDSYFNYLNALMLHYDDIKDRKIRKELKSRFKENYKQSRKYKKYENLKTKIRFFLFKNFNIVLRKKYK